MNVIDMIDKAREAAAVDRVFGRPITQGDVTVIPVARIAGGGGGGGGGGHKGEEGGEGSGGGFGLSATPVGMIVIKGGDVRWHALVDINRFIIGCQVVAIAGLLTIRTLARLRAKGDKRR
ncbi:spore germination protein GerW family protein [Acrocarpospora catenulata]|uniref:spore germination protein GerW family protein n=1 Tax=Acrocarpospora catenulata TaxID=2836182 RepID=UPI001BDB0403|nr:spore germination protein GerW family protein [Acrocarpospora catenulata]